VELNDNVDALRKKGIALAAVSYDSPAILRHFAARMKIRFPMLSDPGSRVIREFGIFNEAIPRDNPFYGIPHPVTYIADRRGRITGKYFEDDYRQRQTLSGALMKDYGVAPTAVPGDIAAKHVTLHTAASTKTVRSGQRILLSVEVRMPKKMHVYAPGTANYIPVQWNLNESANYQVFDVVFPPARTLRLEAIKESVPVYEKTVRLVRDVMIAPDNVINPLLGKQKELVIEGVLRYQACDDRVCYPPENVPVKWTLGLEAHDRTRVPGELRRGNLK
jgi:hypothetical protein